MKKTKLDFSLLRSDRKSCSIQVKSDGSIVVRAPRNMPLSVIEDVVGRREEWIEKVRLRIKLANERMSFIGDLSPEDIAAMTERAKRVIPERAAYFAELIGVEYKKITVRHQKTRWGSCSSKGTLSFNCLLMTVPNDVLDYVIVHELCHLKQMNHSSRFWNEVAKVMPDYRSSYKWLRENGSAIISKMP